MLRETLDVTYNNIDAEGMHALEEKNPIKCANNAWKVGLPMNLPSLTRLCLFKITQQLSPRDRETLASQLPKHLGAQLRKDKI